MPDQDRQMGRVGEPSGSEGRVLLTVPAGVVVWLRRGAYAEIGSAAEAINESAFRDGRGGHQEWFRGPARDLCGVFVLLDAIGWSRTDPPVDAQVDLRNDRRVLMKALEGALGFAEEDIEEGLLRERGAEVERVGVLRDVIAVVQGHIDALAVEEGGVR